MPTYTVIQLSEIGSSAFTATICPQLCSEDVYHTPAAGLWRPRAGHGFSVHRAGLIVFFESFSTLGIVVANTGDGVAGR